MLLGSLFLVLAVLQAADVWTTNLHRRRGAVNSHAEGVTVLRSTPWGRRIHDALPGWWKAAMVKADVEVNPVMALAIAWFGPLWWLPKVGMALGGCAWLAYRWPAAGPVVLGVAIIVYGAVVVRNWRGLQSKPSKGGVVHVR